MATDFRKAILPGELNDLLNFDQQVFGAYPDDLFEPEEWNEYESYWMFEDGVKVGCTAFRHNVDYNENPRQGCLYIASTGVLPECQGKGLGRKQKEWQISYAAQHNFSVIATNMRLSNIKIRKLNEGIGFIVRCEDPDYYHNPDEPAVVMERAVDTSSCSQGK